MNRPISLLVDASVDSALDWRESQREAERIVSRDRRLLWVIELGLFDHLPYPLSDRGQEESLRLALEHFLDTLWTPWVAHSEGVILYRGSADFAATFPWDEAYQTEWDAIASKLKGDDLQSFFLHRFCQNHSLDFLDRLGQIFPPDIPLFVELDLTPLQDPLTEALLLTDEHWQRLTSRFLRDGEPLLFDTIPGGFLLPSLPRDSWEPWLPYLEKMAQFRKEKTPYRCLIEDRFHQEWEGLDWVFYREENISPEGMRKLHGFLAAGGEAFSLTALQKKIS